jgi:hypothetical protein
MRDCRVAAVTRSAAVHDGAVENGQIDNVVKSQNNFGKRTRVSDSSARASRRKSARA